MVASETKSDKKEEENQSVDKGWAWMVVLGSLVINIIYDGCSCSFVIFFPKLLDYFGDTKSNTAWVGSLFFSVPLLCGPIAGLITRKLGNRKATILGGLIASIGVTCGALSNSTGMLCVTFGLVAGVGMSLPYFNSIMVEAIYFKKRRAFATGIAESGAGIGSVIFAPFVSYLISVYDWRGGLLIVGGIVANIIVCGSLFRPIRKRNRSAEQHTKEESHTVNLTDDPEKEDHDKNKYDKAIYKQKSEVVKNKPYANKCNLSKSYKYVCKYIHEDPNLFDINRNISTLYTSGSHASHLSAPNSTCINNIHNPIVQLQNSQKSKTKCILQWNVPKMILSLTSLFQKSCQSCRLLMLRYVKDLLKLTNTQFILFSLLNFIMYFWYDVPYVFLVDKTISMGVSEASATFLIVIIGIVHTIGNICYGLLGDRTWVNKNILYGLSIALCGVSMMAMALFVSYLPLAVLAGLFGLFSAASEAMCSIILIDIVGLTNLDKAFGFVMLLQGIANMLGPPFAGQSREGVYLMIILG